MKRALLIIIMVYMLITKVYAIQVTNAFTVTGQSNTQIMIIVSKGDQKSIIYPKITENKYKEQIYFTSGKGDYLVAIYYHLEGKTWKLKKYYSINYQGDYQYTEHPEIVKLAQSLYKKDAVDWDKAVYIYRQMYNYTYDDEEAKRITENTAYEPHTALQMIRTGKGVCVDYALLFKALCDVSNVRCRVVYGFFREFPHAWNEIYIEGLGWIIVDTTLKTWNSELYKNDYRSDD